VSKIKPDGVGRREILITAGLAALGLGAGAAMGSRNPGRAPAAPGPKEGSAGSGAKAEPWFKISLAEWSVHRAIKDGTLAHLDFPKAAKNEYGIEAVEYVNTLFKEKTAGKAMDDYVAELKKRCADLGVKSVLIMCDGEGALGDADEPKRLRAVDNHRRWLEAGKMLGCHSIRVNAQSSGTYEEQQERAADGLARLCALAEPYGLNVIVENHGGFSSDGQWLAGVMNKVKASGSTGARVGTLPDFGNFCLDWSKSSDPAMWYDRYKGVQELMPFARGVSAKSHEFDEKGDETKSDYRRLLKIVRDAGYRGYVGVEYEGEKLSEPEGIRATKKLLEKVRGELAAG
jgi:sugar phosphate isomerase/epimerase